MKVSRKLTKFFPVVSCAEQNGDSSWAVKNVAKSKYFETALTNKGGFKEKRRDIIQRLLPTIPVRSFQGSCSHASSLMFMVLYILVTYVYVRLGVQLDVHGLICILYSSIFFALHVSGATCTHPQEHKLQRTAIGVWECPSQCPLQWINIP
jgi:hypothetical protein